jgi:UDP-N-acetyl-D-galactosamine dehydrogenase
MKKNIKLAIIGLGYVGLPLALEFSKKRKVIGFDINKKRVRDLQNGIDKNLETTNKEFKESKLIKFTDNKNNLKNANFFIITVPTPINDHKRPDLFPLLKATEIVGKILKKGDIIVYESTVYPGCIEEVCVPKLEKITKFKFNKDFFCGYSPERINPGDKKHTISKIKKITSGSTVEISNLIDDLYREIILAGTHKASSIKVAEAAKVIENTQRDLNIALVNELSIIFNKLNIDTKEVLDAAETKWNFLPFKPGLVGGHCIGVDPYYLTYKAIRVGYKPKVILSGRKINDNMGNHVVLEMIKLMKKKKIKIKNSKILVMGLTFKENCSDIRNSGVKKIIDRLKKYTKYIDLYDPWTDKKEIKSIYNINSKTILAENTYDGIIIPVAHKIFKNMGENRIVRLCKKNHVIYDLKYLFSKNLASLRL